MQGGQIFGANDRAKTTRSCGLVMYVAFQGNIGTFHLVSNMDLSAGLHLVDEPSHRDARRRYDRGGQRYFLLARFRFVLDHLFSFVRYALQRAIRLAQVSTFKRGTSGTEHSRPTDHPLGQREKHSPHCALRIHRADR